MCVVFHFNLFFCTILGLSYALPPYIYDEGSPCITSEGLKGFCIEINYCPSAIDALSKQKELPDVCDFNNDKTPLVCCVKLRKSIEQCMMIRENRNFEPYIINGTFAKLGVYRHMAHIGYLERGQPQERMTFACGASLISNRFLLTASHCKQRGSQVPAFVRLGTLKNPNYKDPNFLKEGVLKEVDKFIQHPEYVTDSRTSFNDIALIRLKDEVEFTNLIQPACLYIKHKLNRKITATGWGITESSKLELSPLLLQVMLKETSKDNCNKLIPSEFRDDVHKSTLLCLSGDGRYKDTCKGDSGGPVQIRERMDQTVHSIVAVTGSGSNPCSGIGTYASVAAYIDWIENWVWP